MIDRPSRNELAQLLRHLAAGRITTRQFADECEVLCCDSEDKAIHGIAVGGPNAIQLPRFRWARRLRGKARLSDEMRNRIAIAALFLYSDYEYEWPEDLSFDMRG